MLAAVWLLLSGFAPSPCPIVATHQAEARAEAIASIPGDVVYMGTYTVTAYCACPKCCGKAYGDPLYGITATGTTATEGRTVAVDPAVIPYGSAVYIDGVRYIAEDCGGFSGKHIDVYIADHNRALRWGLQTCEVWLG